MGRGYYGGWGGHGRWYDDYLDSEEAEEDEEEGEEGGEDEDDEERSSSEDDEMDSEPESSSSSPTAHTIKHRIRRALAGVEPGPFAEAGSVPIAPNPGLSIDGLGLIGIPLSDRDAKAIRSKAYQPHAEKLNADPEDAKSSNSCEIDSTQFQLGNPAWRTMIDKLTLHIRQSMKMTCPTGDIEARLDKLVMCDEGASSMHRGSPAKEVQVFGTMIVDLPCAHKGGNIHLTLDEQKTTHKTSDNSDFGTSYAAWYAGVQQEVSPVVSGHRLVLVYSLVQLETGYRQTAFALEDEGYKLESALRKWKRTKDDAPSALAYLLDHTYSEEVLRPENLRGRDASTVHWMEMACAAEDFNLCLAHLERVVEGEPEDSERGSEARHGHTDKENVFLSLVTDLKGEKVAERMSFDMHDIVQKSLEDEDDISTDKDQPQKGEAQGNTGTTGATRREAHKRSCAVFIPAGRLVDFFLRQSRFEEHLRKSSNLMAALRTQLKDKSCHENASIDLSKFCNLMVTDRQLSAAVSQASPEINELNADQQIGDVILSSLEIGETGLFERSAKLASSETLVRVFPSIGRACGLLGWTGMRSGIEIALDRFKPITETWEAIEMVTEGFMDSAKERTVEDIESFQLWRLELVGKTLSRDEVKQSGIRLAMIAIKYGKEMLVKRIIPLLTSQATSVSVRVSFLANYAKQAREEMAMGVLDPATVQEPLRKVLESMPIQLRLHMRRIPTYLSYVSQRQIEDNTAVSGDDLARLLLNYPALDATWNVDRLCNMISSAIPDATVDDFDKVLLPVAKCVTEMAEKDALVLGSETCSFVLQTLKQYILKYVNQEPYPATSWARQLDRPNCCHDGIYGRPCPDCKEVDQFMKDGRRRQAEFHWGRDRTKHIERELGSGDFNTQLVKPSSTSTGRAATALQITKHRRKRELWEMRYGAASNRIAEIAASGPLDLILGSDFEDIMTLRAVRLPLQDGDPTSTEAIRQPLQSLPTQSINKRLWEGGEGDDDQARKNPTGYGAFVPPPHHSASVSVIDLT